MQIQSCQKGIQVYPFSENTTVSVKNTELFYQKVFKSTEFFLPLPQNLQKTVDCFPFLMATFLKRKPPPSMYMYIVCTEWFFLTGPPLKVKGGVPIIKMEI